MADEEVAFTAPGVPRLGAYASPWYSELRGVPRATENRATLANLLQWMFRDCCADERAGWSAVAYLKESAVRYPDRSATERVFCRYGCRLSEKLPRASPFAQDSPSYAKDNPWGPLVAAQKFRAALQLTVDVHRFVEGMASFRNLRGVPREGGGRVYQYAARLNVLRQFLATSSSAARSRVAPSLSWAIV